MFTVTLDSQVLGGAGSSQPTPSQPVVQLEKASEAMHLLCIWKKENEPVSAKGDQRDMFYMQASWESEVCVCVGVCY